MESRYDDSFSKRYQGIPVAYYLHRWSGTDYPWLDSDGNCVYTNVHNHAEIELLLFESGSGINQVGADKSRIPFCEGDLFIFNPFEVHNGCYLAGTAEQRHLVIDFPASLLEHPQIAEASRLSGKLLSQAVRISNRISPGDPVYAELRAAYLQMFQAVSEDIHPDELSFFGAMYSFFAALVRGGHIHDANDSQAQTDNMAFIKEVLDFISEHYSEPISTRDISAGLRYSKEHFCRLFRAGFSTTFIEYLTQYRVEKAKRYLTDHSSMDVAQLCGFSSQSNFSRAFRESVGISPSEYKKFILSPAGKQKP